ncbi:hypothetical protein M8J77_015159 [Diaphorina citri]|nr:hypothetical protein M8J77_015159 [Diaphorina citri]
MLLLNCVVLSIVLCFVAADLEPIYPGGFGTGYSSGLFASTTQDEDDLWEEERDVEGEDRIIAKLAQIIRDMKLKYAPQPRTPPPSAPHPAFVPDFTYHFPQIDVGSIDFSAIPFAVRPNEPQYYQTGNDVTIHDSRFICLCASFSAQFDVKSDVTTL